MKDSKKELLDRVKENRKKKKVTEGDMVQPAVDPMAPQEEEPVMDTTGAIEAPGMDMGMEAPVAPEPAVPPMAPTPSNPIVPPAPGMIPTGWAYPQDIPQGQVMQTGDVGVIEEPMPMDMEQPAPAPVEMSPEEQEVVLEYRKWKKSRIEECGDLAQKIKARLKARGHDLSDDEAYEYVDDAQYATDNFQSLDDDALEADYDEYKSFYSEKANEGKKRYEECDTPGGDMAGFSKNEPEEEEEEMEENTKKVTEAFEEEEMEIEPEMPFEAEGEEELVDGIDMGVEEDVLEAEGESIPVDAGKLEDLVVDITSLFADAVGPEQADIVTDEAIGLTDEQEIEVHGLDAEVGEEEVGEEEEIGEEDEFEMDETQKEKIQNRLKNSIAKKAIKKELKEKLERRKRKITEGAEEIYSAIRFPAGTPEPKISPEATEIAQDAFFGDVFDKTLESVKRRSAERKAFLDSLRLKELGEVTEPDTFNDDFDEINRVEDWKTSGILPDETEEVKRTSEAAKRIKARIQERKEAREKAPKSKIVEETRPEKAVREFKEKQELNFKKLLEDGFLG